MQVFAVAVGKDLDVNALRSFVKSADDLLLPTSGAELATMSLAKRVVGKLCNFVGRSTFSNF